MLDPTKPVRTSDGAKARIICTNLVGKKPIAAAVMGKDGEESVESYFPDGRFFKDTTCSIDLENVPVLDYKKPVQTRAGLKARILCTDFDDQHYPVVAAIKNAEGYGEFVSTFTLNGQQDCYFRESDEDLINIPEQE